MNIKLNENKISKNAMLYFVVIAFYYISTGAFSMLQGIYIKELNMGESFLGTILSLRILATALFSIPGAMIVNRWGKKKGIMFGAFFVPIACILQGYFENPWLILMVATIQGCAMSFILVAEGPFFMENGTPRNRLRLFSYSFADSVFATMIGYFAFGSITHNLDKYMSPVEALRYSIIFSGIIGLASCIFVFMIKDSKKNYEESSYNIYKNMLSIVGQKNAQRFVIYNFVIGFGAGLVVPYFNVYLKYKVNATTEQIGIIMSLAQAAMGAGGLITPFMAGKYGKVKTIIICQIVSIPFLMLIALPPSIVVVSVALFIRNALMNMATPIVNNMAMEMVKEQERPIFSSLNNISSNLSRALSAVIAGIIMNNFTNGYEIPYFITSIMYIVATIYFYRSFKDIEKKKVNIEL